MAITFESRELGNTPLKNRLATATMTPSRATSRGGTAPEMMRKYYAQRTGDGLIISEGIQPLAVGQRYTDAPGLHSAEQVGAWKPVTTAVHENDGVIYSQLMHPMGPSPVRTAGQVNTHEGRACPRVVASTSDPEVRGGASCR